MARNEEKAQSMLYRFREAQKIDMGLRSRFDKRPPSASVVNNLSEAERWRRDILREMARKIEKINDESLTEHQIRDLNDEINKLLRHRRHWEHRIKELGGPDYFRRKDLVDIEGLTVPGTRGYRYFGRARTLPGVKELFEKADAEGTTLRPEEIWTKADPDYFGLRDDDDELLLAYEQEQFQQARNEIIEQYGSEWIENLDDAVFEAAVAGEGPCAVWVPSESEIEAYLVQKRRQELADMFLGDGQNINAK